MTMADELQKLQALHAQGALSNDEFLQAKRRVINHDAPNDDIDQRVAAGQGASSRPSPNFLQTLTRSSADRWIGGVSGGLAAATNIPTWAWRILFVLTALLHGLGLLMYVLLWIFVPLQQPVVQAVAQPTDLPS